MGQGHTSNLGRDRDYSTLSNQVRNRTFIRAQCTIGTTSLPIPLTYFASAIQAFRNHQIQIKKKKLGRNLVGRRAETHNTVLHTLKQ